jgi:hypothetical protein
MPSTDDSDNAHPDAFRLVKLVALATSNEVSVVSVCTSRFVPLPLTVRLVKYPELTATEATAALQVRMDTTVPSKLIPAIPVPDISSVASEEAPPIPFKRVKDEQPLQLSELNPEAMLKVVKAVNPETSRDAIPDALTSRVARIELSALNPVMDVILEEVFTVILLSEEHPVTLRLEREGQTEAFNAVRADKLPKPTRLFSAVHPPTFNPVKAVQPSTFNSVNEVLPDNPVIVISEDNPFRVSFVGELPVKFSEIRFLKSCKSTSPAAAGSANVDKFSAVTANGSAIITPLAVPNLLTVLSAIADFLNQSWKSKFRGHLLLPSWFHSPTVR